MNTQGWNWVNRLQGRTLATCLVAAWATAGSAATYYVAKTGDDTTGSGTSGSPWVTVGKAVAAAGANDTILVGSGVYTQSVSFASRSQVTLKGGYDASWAWTPATAKTEIFGNGSSPIVIPEGANSNVVHTLTLRGGTGSNKAGIDLTGAAPLLFVDGCTIVSNFYGVGSSVDDKRQRVVLRNTVIARNTSHGVYFKHHWSSGFYCYLYNCTIADNGGNGYHAVGTGDGGWGDIVPVAKNTLFTGNAGYGLYKGGGSTGGSIENCLFYGNTSGPMLYYVGMTILSGNKSGRDPKYLDRAALDFRLAGDSPAAASGKDLSAAPYLVTQDILGTARPQGAAWDMGAYESNGAGEGALASATYVSKSGSDATGSGTAGSPWGTIQYALGLTAPNGTVRVSAGTYAENVSFGPGQVRTTLQGGYTPGTWVWDPSNQVVTVHGTVNSPVVLCDGAVSNTLNSLTLKGGTGSNKAGIEFTGSAPYLVVDACTIVSNCYGTYSPNYLSQRMTLRNTLIARSTTDGMYFGWQVRSDVALYNCTIADNGRHGYFATGIWADAVPVAKNTLFTGNNGYGLRKEGGSTGGSMQNCLFFGNRDGAVYAPTGFGDLGANKSGRDPLYLDPVRLDYRVAANSPAAAAGMNLSGSPYFVTTDIVNVSRPQGANWDMGVYEGAGAGEPPLSAVAYVSTGGNDATGDGSQGAPWRTIGHALGYSLPNATIYIAAGTYLENINLGADKKQASLRGGYNPSSWAWNPVDHPTVIDGRGNSPIMVAAAANSNVLHTLTLKGGTGSNKAGIEIAGSAPYLFVEGCTIVSNFFGIYNYRVTPQTLRVRNTVIARNTSHGIYFGDQALSDVTLHNCTIADNGGSGYYATGTGDGQWDDAVPKAKNTLFTGNGGYGLYKGGGSPGGTIENCLFFSNRSGAANYFVGITMMGGNKSGRDPRYVAAAALNYRVSADSPAASAGLDLSGAPWFVVNDIINVSRPQGAAWDMGAYESDGTGEGALPSVVYVRKTGSDATGDGSATQPWATIQRALGYVASAGLVNVGAGVYAERLDFGPGRSEITLRGGYNPETWAWEPATSGTVVDGAGYSPVLVAGGANSNVLSHLTLRGGSATGEAGIRLAGVAPYLFIESCSIVSNWYGVYGPRNLHPTVRVGSTLIARNKSHGLFFSTTYPPPVRSCYLYNCTIADNGGSGFNSIGNGSGDALPIARNCLFTGNIGYGIYKGGVSLGASMENCLFYGNTTAPTKCDKGFTDLGGTITVEPPAYAGKEPHPYQLSRNSPAFNRGLDLSALGVTTDILGVARPQQKLYDRGAYELYLPPGGTVFLLR